jgi:hypothetical protein
MKALRRSAIAALRGVASGGLGADSMESNDHNAQVGEGVVRDIVAAVASIGGTEGLAELAADLAVRLAESIERMAAAEGLAVVDLVDLLFLDEGVAAFATGIAGDVGRSR